MKRNIFGEIMEWLDVMQWFKKPPTVDDIIAASFYEEGRWIATSTNIWTDSITGAIICSHGSGDLYINDVPVPQKVHAAFWEMVSAPRIKAEQDKRDDLDALYSGVRPTKPWSRL